MSTRFGAAGGSSIKAMISRPSAEAKSLPDVAVVLAGLFGGRGPASELLDASLLSMVSESRTYSTMSLRHCDVSDCGARMSGSASNALNARLFVNPELTRQFDFARCGILSPSQRLLHPNQYSSLYRFGHSTLSDDENLSSPWWSDYETYVSIKSFSEKTGASLTVSTRHHNAQTDYFGPADVIFKVGLRAPLLSFQGVGRPMQDTKGRSYFPPNVVQTFVPGLRAWPNKIRSALWFNAFDGYTKSTAPAGAITIFSE